MFPEPIYIFGVPFRLFGLVAASAIFLSYYQIEKEMRRLKIPINILPDLFLSILAGAFLIARLFFVLSHLQDYIPLTWNSVKFWEGGIVLYGGLLGGLLGGYLFCRIKGVSFLKLSDPVAIGLALGLAISRLGCFAAGCCYGKPTHMPWGIAFHDQDSLALPLHAALHPTQLYAFFIGMGVYFILMVLKNKKSFEGELILSYLILTSLGRLFVDCFRAETHVLYFTSTLLVLCVSSFFYFRGQLKTKQRRVVMRNNVLRLASFFLIAFLITACGIVRTQKISRGLDIATSDVNSIQKGVTTDKEVMKLFGPPTKVRDTAEGQQFFYEYTKSGGPQLNLVVSVGGGTLTKTLMVWFDKQGVVTDYAYKAS